MYKAIQNSQQIYLVSCLEGFVKIDTVFERGHKGGGTDHRQHTRTDVLVQCTVQTDILSDRYSHIVSQSNSFSLPSDHNINEKEFRIFAAGLTIFEK